MQPDPRWSMFMTASIPDCDCVGDLVLQRCESTTEHVDGDRLRRAVTDAMWGRLHELTSGRTDVAWDSLAPVRATSDADHRHLSAYLSTRGAVGLALNDKLRSYMLYVLPQQFAIAVEQGLFDRCDLDIAREQ